MARPTVLVVDTNESRRKELSRGLAEFAYEVVSADSAANGTRFAAGLNPNVLVAGAELEGFGDCSVLGLLPRAEGERPALLVLLAECEASGEGEEDETPDNVRRVPVAGLTSDAILRKLRTVLLGVEIGLEADERLESLLGDLQLTSLFDMLPLLQRSVVTGRLLAEEGELLLADGEVTAARCGNARGIKAFCRLARTAGGAYRLLLGPTGLDREIDMDVLSLMAAAMEDQHRFDEVLEQLPDPDSRVRIQLGPAFFATQFTPTQQEVLKAAQSGPTIRGLVDAAAVADGVALEELVRLGQHGFVEFEEPEARVRVVTDSTADLPVELAARHRIVVVPLSVSFGDETFKDGVDLTPGAFYKLLESRKSVHPHTSPPARSEFLETYRAIAKRGGLVSIHISEKMSQTVVHARGAIQEMKDELSTPRSDGSAPLAEVLDGGQVSAGLGLLAVLAARMAHRRLSAYEVRRRIEEMRARLHLLFVVNTLEYLARGGRIGKARALLGGLLGIKPILGVIEGEVAPVDRVRGGKAAHPRLVRLFRERVDPARPVIVGLAHAAAPLWADRLRGYLEANFRVQELLQCEIGPVVGTHVGPGCVGAVMFQPTEAELPLIAPLPAAD